MADLGNLAEDLRSRQLTAFAMLGSLCHFELDLFGIAQVVRRDTEPARSDLLDR